MIKRKDYSKLPPIDWKTAFDGVSIDDWVLQYFFFHPSEFLGRPILVEVKGSESEPILTNLERESWSVSQPYSESLVETAEGIMKSVVGPRPDITVNRGEHYRVVKRGADVVIHTGMPFYCVNISGKDYRDVELLTPVRQVVFKKRFIREAGKPYWNMGTEGVVLEYAVWQNQEFGVIWQGLYDMTARWMKRHGITSVSRRQLKNFRGQMMSDESFCLVLGELPNQKEWSQAFSLFPIKSVAYDIRATTPAVAISEGWLGLREMLFNLAVSKMSRRDAYIISWFAVPPESRMTRRDIKAAMVSSKLIPTATKEAIVGIRQDAIDAVIRRKLTDRQAAISPNDLGVVGEQFALSRILLSIKTRAHLAGGIGQCDISNREDGDPASVSWAINVKLSLEENINRSYHTTPECDAKRAWLLVLSPRSLAVHLWPICAEHTVCSDSPTSENFCLCVTVEELGETVRQLIEGELEI